MARGEAGADSGWPRRHRGGAAAALLLLGLVAAVVIVFAPAGRHANAAIDRCGGAGGAVTLLYPLPHVARRIAEDRALTIVALGSSSTYGTGASRPENAYPSRLGTLLAARFPGLRVRVINRGVGGEEAGAMTARIDRDVLTAKPDLVIWQVGTNGALRDTDPAAIGAAVRSGIERIEAAGADVMLMNLQYAPAVLRHEGYREILHALDAVAFAEAVPLYPRFAIMRHWLEEGRMTLRRMLARDRLHMTDASYDCLARGIAATIGAAARPHATMAAGGA